MNLTFYDMIGKVVEVDINDIVVKTKKQSDHIDNLKKAYARMKKHNLKMNSGKKRSWPQGSLCLGRVQELNKNSLTSRSLHGAQLVSKCESAYDR